MKPVSISMSVQEATNPFFRGSILSFYKAHNLASFLFGDRIHIHKCAKIVKSAS